MKIRTGYVSNSSSSSFCIIGKEICCLYEIDCCLDRIDKDKKYVIRGIEGYEGEYLVFLSGKEAIKLFSSNTIKQEYSNCNLIEIIANSFYGDQLKIPNITLDAECFYGTRDINGIGVDNFKNQYMQKK